ncbi:hypothetical protein PR202_gb10173 [Eleusine coracana subsp. coracana]|uniref:Uncharacterized protein n=1 Tax=Eleusine coracana subsp. coracana TaxID=191504 RepID=A0AAV5EIL9_ELECO|nr:hypothetical protein PR202_gb10173 [Eleusine coracana subsp. coracana]
MLLGNPANDLVALINGKRAASKLPALRNSAGLGCMALQYISECIDDDKAKGCSSNNTVECEPPEAHITEVYAANCGVELPTVDVISGHLIGCQTQTQTLVEEAMLNNNKNNGNGSALSVIRSKDHTQVGAAFDRAHRRGPFFWCLLFSSGSANSTFLLEAAGKGIQQTHGCSSGPDRLSCNAAPSNRLIGAAVLLLHFQLFHVLLS